MTKALATFMLALAIITQECDISSLLDLIVTYNVTVQNAGTQAAFVNVRLSDVTRGAYIGPGHSVSVTSFVGGKYTIAVVPYDPATNADLDKLGADLESKLTDPDALSAAEVTALTAQLKLVQNQLVLRQIGVGSATCSGQLKQDPDPKNKKDLALSATATNRGAQWSLTGC